MLNAKFILIGIYWNLLGFETEKIIQGHWCNPNLFKTFKPNHFKDSNINIKLVIWTKGTDTQETIEEIIEEEEEEEEIREVEEEEANIEISKTIIIKIINKNRAINSNSNFKNPIHNPFLKLLHLCLSHTSNNPIKI